MNSVYVSIGSNMGDRMYYLKEALRNIDNHPSIKVVNVSSIYETDPVGYEDQDLFLNMVALLETVLSPIELLDVCQGVEKSLGRKREVRWGPRTLDLDILLYNVENIVSERLVIPHPRMHERSFVLIPLMELGSEITLPTLNKSLREMTDQLPDREGVRIWKRKNGEDVFALFEN